MRFLNPFQRKQCLHIMATNNTKLPQSIVNKFETKENSNYNLRNNYTNFVLNKPKSSFIKKSINYSAANKLPKSVKKEENSVAYTSLFLTVAELSKNFVNILYRNTFYKLVIYSIYVCV